MSLFAAMLPSFDPIQMMLMIIPLLFAVIVHEVAHGYVAFRLGDPTAKLAGRLSLNPVRHIDPLGSLILPAALAISGSQVIFGYAKPVPVNFSNLMHSRWKMAAVAAAGAAANLLLALISGGVFQIINHFKPIGEGLISGAAAPLLLQLFAYSAIINLVLGFFNLLPIPPLDGGRILTLLLPAHIRQKIRPIEPLGFFILILFLFTNLFDLFVSFLITPLVNLLIQG